MDGYLRPRGCTKGGLRAGEAGSSCTDGHTQSWRRQMESRKRKAPARRAALSPQHEAALRNIALRARSQTDGIRVREIAADASAPAGATVLFTGVDSATAQEAAAVLANEVGREIYRVDLKEVTSKYIGETEKNLRRLFADAEKRDSVLLLDEADALFGTRTEVKDAHDRYANLDVSYLL